MANSVEDRIARQADSLRIVKEEANARSMAEFRRHFSHGFDSDAQRELSVKFSKGHEDKPIATFSIDKREYSVAYEVGTFYISIVNLDGSAVASEEVDEGLDTLLNRIIDIAAHFRAGVPL